MSVAAASHQPASTSRITLEEERKATSVHDASSRL